MKKALPVLMLMILPFTVCSCAGETNAQESSPEARYVELKSGFNLRNGMFTKKQAKVISVQTDYEAEYATYTNEAAPAVDFARGRVLLVDMGGRSTGGYSIKVASVDVSDNWVVANVKLIKPGPSCMVTSAFTNPFQFVFIPTSKEILVSESIEITKC